MNKKKIKLSLIDDYIKIVLIKNFLKNSFNSFELYEQLKQIINQTKYLDFQLADFYEKLIIELKLNTLSFDILKQNLEKNNNLYKVQIEQKFENLAKIICKTNLDLINIFRGLKTKVQQLKVKMDIPFITN